MGDATARFLTALQSHAKVKGAGRDRWRATCPAHGGEGLNLAVAKGDQGVLVKCWSNGCAERDIASSVGLRLEDLFDEGGRAEYDYGGGHKVVRTRTPTGKTIRQVNAPATTGLYTPAGSRPIESSPVVFLGEGEKTVDALVRMGVPCAASWPGGSNGVGKVDLSVLDGKDVRVIPDNDAPGEKAALALLERLKTAKVLRVPEIFNGVKLNDAADLWLAGGTVDDLAEAEVVDSEFEDAVAAAQFQERVRYEARQRAEQLRRAEVSDTLSPKPLGAILAEQVTYDWLVPDLLERKDRLVLTGHEGSGKSWMLRQMVIAMAAGVHPLAQRHTIDPLRALVVDAENTEQQWSRTTRYMTAIAERHGRGKPRETVTVAAGVRLDISQPGDLNQIHRLIDVHKPDVLYIGPLYKLIGRAITTDDDAAPLIIALDALRERGLCLLMEAHAGHAKGLGGNRDLRPRGSSALLGWPEFGFGIEPLEEDDTMARWVPWRGQREQRRWPKYLRKGVDGEFPWMVAE